MSAGESVFQVMYWPTERVCATYDTREEAFAAVRWYERTYDCPLDHLGVREIPNEVPA